MAQVCDLAGEGQANVAVCSDANDVAPAGSCLESMGCGGSSYEKGNVATRPDAHAASSSKTCLECMESVVRKTCEVEGKKFHTRPDAIMECVAIHSDADEGRHEVVAADPNSLVAA